MMANSPPTRSQPHPFRSELALKAPPSSSSSQSRADRHHCRAGARLHVEAHLRPSSGQASRRNEFHSTHSTFPSRSPTSSVVTSPESGRHRRASPLLRRRTTPVDLRPRILRQTESELADGNYTLVRELVEEEVHNGEVNALVTEQVPQDPEPNCEQEDLLARAWGWDWLVPCSSLHYWSQYKKYLHDYYHHNSSKANADPNLNGDDENGLAALADSCIKMENELESMMMRRPKTLNDYNISLSNKITKRAHEMRNMKCSEFPAAAVALKCITKEADLMCQLLMCGCTTSALIFCGRIREHALSFMTYKGHEHVAAAATMMAASKEASIICELMKNESDNQASQFLWSKTIRGGALRAMVKIFNECSAEDSTMGSIAEKSVSGESDDKNCSKNGNSKETDKINQETKEEDVEENYLDKSEEQKMEVESVKEDKRVTQMKHHTYADDSKLEFIKINTDEECDETD